MIPFFLYAITACLVFLVFTMLVLIGLVQHLGVKMTKAFDEMKHTLGEINTATNEVAGDLQEVIDKLDSIGAGSALTPEEAAEISTTLQAHRDVLRSIASKYPAAATDPDNQ